MWYYTPFSSLKFARILLLYISGCREGGKQTCHTNFIVQFQKISILPPQKGLKFPGGFCNARKFKELYEAYIIGIFRGVEGGGALEKIPSMGEVCTCRDIYWNYTWYIFICKCLFSLFKPPEIQFFGASMLHFKISKNW